MTIRLFASFFYRNLCVFLFAPFLWSASISQAKDCLSFIAQDNDFARELSHNVSIALETADICHTIDYFPAKRADLLFPNEKYDGFIARVGQFEQNSPQKIIKISPPIASATGVLVTKSGNIHSLDGLTTEILGIVRGWLWMEKISLTYPHTIRSASIIDLAEMFQSNNVDAVLMPRVAADYLLYGDYFIRDLVNLNMYVYLKQRKIQSAAPLSEAIKTHLSSGGLFFRLDLYE